MPSPRRRRTRPSDPTSDFPTWVAPQLTELVEKAPAGDKWAHEIKLDGYRMHARIDRGHVQLLTRTGLDWTAEYPTTVTALQRLPVEQAYIDGELCAVSETGVTSFGLMQAATDSRHAAALTFYAFDLLYLDGENPMRQPLAERKRRLQRLLDGYEGGIRYCDHQIGLGP
jgi:ATP-dependent DNA ligase